MSRLSVENFLSRSLGKLLRGTLLCFTNFLVSKKSMEKKREGKHGGIIKNFRLKCFVSSVENIRRGIF